VARVVALRSWRAARPDHRPPHAGACGDGAVAQARGSGFPGAGRAGRQDRVGSSTLATCFRGRARRAGSELRRRAIAHHVTRRRERLDDGNALMHRHKLSACWSHDAFELRGLMTVKDITKHTSFPTQRATPRQARVALHWLGEGTDERVELPCGPASMRSSSTPRTATGRTCNLARALGPASRPEGRT